MSARSIRVTRISRHLSCSYQVERLPQGVTTIPVNGVGENYERSTSRKKKSKSHNACSSSRPQRRSKPCPSIGCGIIVFRCFFKDTSTTEIYSLTLLDALPALP